jgi:hypothetical protein
LGLQDYGGLAGIVGLLGCSSTEYRVEWNRMEYKNKIIRSKVGGEMKNRVYIV